MGEKRGRKAPMVYQFAGMQLLVGTYKANGRVDLSFKGPGMQRVFTREYKPNTVGDESDIDPSTTMLRIIDLQTVADCRDFLQRLVPAFDTFV